MSFSVIVPVLDGARYLPELLAAVFAQGHDVEVLVVDSGSTDGSVAIATEAGATVIEIPNAEFGHGRTRNLAAERTRGELICFLTQDATPEPGWLDAYAAAFAADERLGAAFGPHLPRPDTSVMIARELTEFFAGFPVGVHAEPVFLSNVNACYRRSCWEQVRFDDVAYAEDQAFARAMGDQGWERAYVPGAGVLHAHDYSPLGFARRYFDEYRGLRETAGHAEPLDAARRLRPRARGPALDGRPRLGARQARRRDRPLGGPPHHAQVRCSARLAGAPAPARCGAHDLARTARHAAAGGPQAGDPPAGVGGDRPRRGARRAA
jgi:rhamnosyltransferase